MVVFLFNFFQDESGFFLLGESDIGVDDDDDEELFDDEDMEEGCGEGWDDGL